MRPDAIVMIIGAAMALVLAARAVRSHRMSFERSAAMAVAWIVIIVVLAFVLQRYTP